MRAELDALADALEARKPDGLLAVKPEPLIPLDDPRRDRLVTRGIQIAKELGAEIDPAPASPPGNAPADPPRRRGRVDFGGA